MNVGQNYDPLYLGCHICCTNLHFYQNCPNISFVPDREKIVTEHIYCPTQKRYQKCQRKQLKINSYKENKRVISFLQYLPEKYIDLIIERGQLSHQQSLSVLSPSQYNNQPLFSQGNNGGGGVTLQTTPPQTNNTLQIIQSNLHPQKQILEDVLQRRRNSDTFLFVSSLNNLSSIPGNQSWNLQHSPIGIKLEDED